MNGESYDFDRPENKAAFENKRAHVVCCAFGGYGVLEYIKKADTTAKGIVGIKRHGYELGKRGVLSRDTAEKIANELNYAQSEHLRTQLQKRLGSAAVAAQFAALFA